MALLAKEKVVGGITFLIHWDIAGLCGHVLKPNLQDIMDNTASVGEFLLSSKQMINKEILEKKKTFTVAIQWPICQKFQMAQRTIDSLFRVSVHLHFMKHNDHFSVNDFDLEITGHTVTYLLFPMYFSHTSLPLTCTLPSLPQFSHHCLRVHV